MAVAYRRILRGAPADASRCQSRSAVGCHGAAACRRGLGDIAHVDCRHRRKFYILKCLKALLFAVARPLLVGGVGSDVIGGVCRQACYTRCEVASAVAVGSVAVAYRRVLARTPADASRCHCGVAVRCHVTAACRCDLGDVGYFIGCNNRHRFVHHCREFLLFAVARPFLVGSVGSHIIFGVMCQIGDVGGIGACSATIGCLIVVYCRVLARAPADASRCHCGVAVGCHGAA